jgi:hypothetical protein
MGMEQPIVWVMLATIFLIVVLSKLDAETSSVLAAADADAVLAASENQEPRPFRVSLTIDAREGRLSLP